MKTTEIARAIGKVLEGRGLEVAVTPPEEVQSVEGFDAAVLGSAVYAGHWLKPAMELVERLGTPLAAVPVWLFSSGPIGDPPKPEEDPVDVAQLMEATTGRRSGVGRPRSPKRCRPSGEGPRRPLRNPWLG